MRRFLLLSVILLTACGKAASTAERPTPTPPAPTATLRPVLEQIAFSSDRDGLSQVMVMNADGSGETSLTAAYGEHSGPSWSPDGSRIAMSGETFRGGIVVMDVHQENGQWVTSPPQQVVPGFNHGARWSPDGSRLVYVDGRGDQGWQISTVPAAGGTPVAVPGIPEGARDVDWSPDGSRFVYSFYVDVSASNEDLYLINADGSGLMRLTNTPEISEQGPAWSPDGTRIAFSASSYAEGPDYGDSNLYIVNADGSGLTQVTDDPADEFDPAWSPDGSQLAFVSDRFDFGDGNYELFVINIDGSSELRLTNNHFTDRWPSWRAAPPATVALPCTPGAGFVAEPSIPSGTRFAASLDFVKTWRLINRGACAWTPTVYTLRFIEGEQMGGPDPVPMPGAVQPGATVDLALPLIAPATPGLHTGRWGLYDGYGGPVPGPDGSPLALEVSIEVLAPGSTVLPAPLYFLSERSGSRQVWRMEADSATLIQITSEPAAVDSYAVSRAGNGVAYVSQGQLFLADRDGAGRQAIAGPVGDVVPRHPVWSPDGGRLAYALGGIHLYDAANGEDRLLAADGFPDEPFDMSVWSYSPLSWSPDGGKLLALKGYYEGADLVVLSAGDGTELVKAQFESMYAWHGDGGPLFLASARYVSYMGLDPGLYRVDGEYEIAHLIADAYVWWPLLRPDGQLQYFLSRPLGIRPMGYEVTDHTITLVQSNADASGQVPLRSQALLLYSGDTFDVTWLPDGSAFVALIERRPLQFSEVLLFPASDEPPVYLLQTGEDFQWEK